MEYKALKNIAKITMGQSPDSSSYNEDGIGIPFFQGNADFGELYPNERIWCNSPKKIAKAGDILISVRAPIGALNYAKDTCCIGRGLAAITVQDEAERNYIFHLLRAQHNELNNKGTGSTFKAIGKAVLEEIQVPQISQREQQKCMDLMDSMEAVLRKRKKQLSLFDNLIKARFVEMFGDLKANDKGWPIVKFNECAEIDTNMIHDFTGYEHYPHIGIDSIEKYTGRLVGYRTIAEDGVISGKYLFSPNHIIYSKIRPNLNKVAMPEFEGLCSADAYPIRIKDGVCTREYFGYTLRSQFFLDYILAFSSRTNLPKVNKNQVEGFRLPLPDYREQLKFSSFVKQVDKSKFVFLI